MSTFIVNLSISQDLPPRIKKPARILLPTGILIKITPIYKIQVLTSSGTSGVEKMLRGGKREKLIEKRAHTHPVCLLHKLRT